MKKHEFECDRNLRTENQTVFVEEVKKEGRVERLTAYWDKLHK